MRGSIGLALAVALAGSLDVGRAVAQSEEHAKDGKTSDPAPADVLPCSLSGFSDSGVFHFYFNEERLVRIQFAWKEDGSFDNKSVMEFAGQKLAMSTNITPDKDGYWNTIAGTSREGDFHLERTASKVRSTLAGKTKNFSLKSGALLFENFAPALLSLSVRAYDAAKGGKQTMPIVVIPHAQANAVIERKDAVERTVAEDLKLTRYLFVLGGVEITVWADAAGKVYLADVPSQSAAYVRDGYDALRKAEVSDPLLSRPEFAVKEELNLRVAMRDGVNLATDVYRPDRPGKYPAILVRTPYKKDLSSLAYKYYARRGYVVAIQDCRGRFASEGAWEPFINEGRDGYDAIEWLASQPFCDAKVGMIGASYCGYVQWFAAAERPPHLVTIIPNVTPPDPFYNFPYEYGAFNLQNVIWWYEVLKTDATDDISGTKLKTLIDKRYHKQLKQLPVIDLDKAVLGREDPNWRKWIEHSTDDAYWQMIDFHSRLDKVNIPVFHQSGWFDGDGIGSKLNYARMTALGHANQKLTLGPWGHTDVATRTHEGHDFGPEALRDLPRDYLRWFDFWLKGIDNDAAKEPLVSIFVMKSNKWLYGPKYPLPETRFEKWYLTSGGNANTSLGDGKLTRELPSQDAPPDCYSYDPGDPTPHPDIPEESPDHAEDKNNDRREELTKCRRDILVYKTEPFDVP